MRTVIQGLPILIACAATSFACSIRSEVGHVGRDAAGALGDGGAGLDAFPDSAAQPEGGAPGAPNEVDGGGGGADAGAVSDAMTPNPLSACTPDIAGRVPPAPLRRLQSAQYRSTVRVLLGLAVPDKLAEFDDGALIPAGLLPSHGPTTYHDVAHDLATEATRDAATIGAITKCNVTTMDEGACLERVLEVVARLLRQPIDAADLTEWQAVFAEGRSLGGDLASGVRAVLEVALQAPEFLYRVEIGEPVPGAPSPLGRPRPFEMAARLSYLLWGSAPDENLWQAASAGRLATTSDIEQQARRMLGDTRARDPVREFYLGLVSVPPPVVPANPGVLRSLFRDETAAFVDEVIWSGAGDLRSLLTAPFGFVNQQLAEHYGIPGVVGAGLQKVTLPPGQRRGLLTQGAFLSGAAGVTVTQRGLQIATSYLCAPWASGAAMVPNSHLFSPPDPMATGQTTRQYVEQLTGGPGCSSCHRPLDSIGFSFGHYDREGRWMDTEGGLAIDARGEISETDAAGTFDGALELAQRLADSRDVLACHADHWMRFAYGRDIGPSDVCSREVVRQGFAKSGGNVRALLLTLTQTEAFLYRPAP